MKKLNTFGIIAIGLIIGIMAIGCESKEQKAAKAAAEVAAAEAKKTAELLAVLGGSDVEAIGTALSSLNAAALSTLAVASGSPGGDFEYYLTKTENGADGIAITKYTGNGGLVIIPPTIEGIPVVDVNCPAEYLEDRQWFYKGSTGALITAAVIPETVKSLNFDHCERLHTVNIPAGVNINYREFRGCTELYNLTIGDNVSFPEGYEEMVYDSKTHSEKPTGRFIKYTPANFHAFEGCRKLKLTTRQKLIDLGYPGGF